MRLSLQKGVEKYYLAICYFVIYSDHYHWLLLKIVFKHSNQPNLLKYQHKQIKIMSTFQHPLQRIQILYGPA